MPNEKRIQRRKDAIEIIDYAIDIGHTDPEFWELLVDEIKRRDLLQASVDNDDDPYAAMSPAEAKKFGNTLCKFGKHSGVEYHNIPYDYLAFIADNNRTLIRYVKYRKQLEPSNGED